MYIKTFTLYIHSCIIKLRGAIVFLSIRYMSDLKKKKMIQMNIRVDEEVKRKAEIACNKMGMNISTAINIFLVKMGNEQRIPFEVSVDSNKEEA